MTQTRKTFIFSPDKWVMHEVKDFYGKTNQDYRIFIQVQDHLGGDSPIVQVYIKETEDNYSQTTSIFVFVNSKGDITLTAPILPESAIKIVIM